MAWTVVGDWPTRVRMAIVPVLDELIFERFYQSHVVVRAGTWAYA